MRLEEQIKREFEKLHEFLRDEQKALLLQLQEETRHKHGLIEGKMKRLSDESRALLNEARQLQADLTEDDYTFLMVKPRRGAAHALGSPWLRQARAQRRWAILGAFASPQDPVQAEV